MTIAAPVIYRMSKSGDCVRALVADQYEHPEVRWHETQALLERSAEEGNLHEGAVKAKLRKEGYTVSGEQDEYVIQILPGVLLVGHGDGFVQKKNEPTKLLEVKSMSSKQFAKWAKGEFGQFPRYAAQITSYMTANPGLDVLYVVKRREDGLESRITIPANETPIPFKVIRSKILTAERYRRKGDYPPCDLETQWGCPFGYLHDEAEDLDEPMELTDEMEAVLVDLVRDYRTFKELEDAGEEAAQERKEKINPSLLNMLGGNKKVEVEWDGKVWTVSKSGQSRTWIDLEALRAEHPEIVEKYEKASRVEFPLVREKKSKEK